MYSSLIVGKWNTSNGSDGNNVKLCGAFKTADGIVVVGQHTGAGGQLPIVNVPVWGNTLYNGQSAIITHLRSDNLSNPIIGQPALGLDDNTIAIPEVLIFPNPSDNSVTISLDQGSIRNINVSTMEGKTVLKKDFSDGDTSTELDISSLSTGIYLIRIEDTHKNYVVKKLIRK